MIDIFLKNPPEFKSILSNAVIALAGAGGLGSNAALVLARAGIGTLILGDFDKVEPSNLNRQAFFLSDINKPKVEALSYYLYQINPKLKVIKYNEELNPQNIIEYFKDADLLIEAFDLAENKIWLIETWMLHFPHKPVILGNGLGGYGKTDLLKVRREGNLIICGDGISGMDLGLCGARVAIVANMQANLAIEYLVNRKKPT